MARVGGSFYQPLRADAVVLGRFLKSQPGAIALAHGKPSYRAASD